MIESIKRFFKSMDPLFWVFIAILIAERLMNGTENLGDAILSRVLMLPGIVIGISLHEAGHAYTSYWLGDPTPKAQGRLSVNPLRHIDPMGFLFLLIAGFGWGRPVEINPAFYKKKRRDEFIVSIAGVTVNLIVAIIFSFISKGILTAYQQGPSDALYYLYMICAYVVYMNLLLMVFNLIPCPPLDGWGIVTQIFNLRKYDWWLPVYRRGSLILMAIIIFGLTGRIISPIVSALMDILL
ncbi:MAG: site-2 protease family protein [Clostridia bacterium]|nr:site-2 protease family protein [Clostridia bacterium]